MKVDVTLRASHILIATMSPIILLLVGMITLVDDGGLDPAFGAVGYVTTSIDGDDRGRSVTIQPDGRIVVAGYAGDFPNSDFALVRYSVTGTLDHDFGADGVVTTTIGSSNDTASSVALQSDNKIVIAGESWDGSRSVLAAARYTVTGTLDTGFGSGGIVTTSVGSIANGGSAITVQPDGKIVVAGSSLDNFADGYQFAVVRYNSNGSLDTTFGWNGIVTTSIGANSWDYGNSIAVQPDGKIVVAGGSSGSAAVVRYNITGTLDTSFNSDGIATTVVPGYWVSGAAVVLQADGKIVLTGGGARGSKTDFTVVRYNMSGTLDSSFGLGGIVTTSIGSGTDFSRSAALQSDGRIVVAGSSAAAGRDNFAVARYTRSGALDSAFGVNGIVTTSIGVSSTIGHAVAIQPDGRIVIAGYSFSGVNNDLAVARYSAHSYTEVIYLPLIQR